MPQELKWRQPEPISKLEWQANRKYGRQMLWIYLKWLIPLVCLSIYAVYRLAPENLYGTLRLLPVFVAFPVFIWFMTWVSVVVIGVRYRMLDKGIEKSFMQSYTLILWDDIEAFRFLDHPDFPGIRIVELSGQRIKQGTQLIFDSSVLNESSLMEYFSDHLKA